MCIGSCSASLASPRGRQLQHRTLQQGWLVHQSGCCRPHCKSHPRWTRRWRSACWRRCRWELVVVLRWASCSAGVSAGCSTHARPLCSHVGYQAVSFSTAQTDAGRTAAGAVCHFCGGSPLRRAVCVAQPPHPALQPPGALGLQSAVVVPKGLPCFVAAARPQASNAHRVARPGWDYEIPSHHHTAAFCCLIQVALPLALSEVESRLRSHYYRQPEALARWAHGRGPCRGQCCAALHCIAWPDILCERAAEHTS